MELTLIRRCALLVLPMLLVACRPDPVTPDLYEVPAIIQPYVDAFEMEAAKRGIELDISNLQVEFTTDLDDGKGNEAAGLCHFQSASNPTPRIELDTTSFNWQNNLYHREILVFHELGHCILNRLHRDNELPNGNIASIMRSTGEQVYGGILNGFKRDYYIDELFDENTPAPDWATNQPAYNSASYGANIFIDEFVDNRNSWPLGNSTNSRTAIQGGDFIFESKSETSAFFLTKNVLIDTDKDFEIEARIKLASGERPALLQWGGNDGSDLYFFGFSRDSSILAGNWQEGLVLGQQSPRVKADDYNVLTIRKTGTFYHIYLNGEYQEIFEFEPFFGNKIAFYIGQQSTMQVDYLRIRELL
ncbi:MAG: hypothetical protein NWR72_16520 [Bacteroidia bacterium]|nr:hypothetical protein [Bacteroidia bacterium]